MKGFFRILPPLVAIAFGTTLSLLATGSRAVAMPPPPGCCAATWEQKSTSTDPKRSAGRLGAGTMVNNDSQNSRVRIHVDVNSDACWASSVHEYADRNIGFNVDLGELTPGDKLANRRKSPSYDTDWTTPPSNSSPFTDTSDIFAVVHIKCMVANGKIEDVDKEFKSGFLRVPDRKITNDSQTVRESDGESGSFAGHGGADTGLAGANVNVSATGKRTSDHTTASVLQPLDPLVKLQLVFRSPLPRGWSLAVTPAAFVLGPRNKSANLSLSYRAPSAGAAAYYIKRIVTAPGSRYVGLGKVHLLVAGGPSVWNGLPVSIEKHAMCKLWWAMPGGSLVAMGQGLHGRSRTATFAIKAGRTSNLALLVPRLMFGGASPAFAIDGRPVAAHVFSSNELVHMLALPVRAGSRRLTMSGIGVSPGRCN